MGNFIVSKKFEYTVIFVPVGGTEILLGEFESLERLRLDQVMHQIEVDHNVMVKVEGIQSIRVNEVSTTRVAVEIMCPNGHNYEPPVASPPVPETLIVADEPKPKKRGRKKKEAAAA